MAIHQSLIFMPDGAPCHQSKIFKQFLTKNHIKILDWPGNSLDLSLIENLWFKMKDLVSQKHPGFSSELVKIIKEVWVKEISGEYCESLIYNMLQQLQAVIELVEDTQSTKNVCIYIINIVIYMFPSFSHNIIAIYFSSLYQNNFFVGKALHFRVVRYFCT